jgi:hypothetical protein
VFEGICGILCAFGDFWGGAGMKIGPWIVAIHVPNFFTKHGSIAHTICVGSPNELILGALGWDWGPPGGGVGVKMGSWGRPTTSCGGR